ncbi:MAG: hypothetical protein ACLPR9_09955 [Acidimicrobiales bacterium]
MISHRLSLDAIRSKRLPGAGTGSDGSVQPLYTDAAASPEATHYLVGAVERAIALLAEARPSANSDLQLRIDDFLKNV